MKVKINVHKTIEQNAALYYEDAKKIKGKLLGATESIENTKQKLAKLEAQEIEKKKIPARAADREKKWYEKFHWFISSNDFLVIGGKDATSNEIIVKKHAEPDDLVLHTDLAGSPFVIIKANGKKIDDKTVKEAAQFCAAYSKAWKLGLGSAEVYMIKPEQVQKDLGLPKGSFMIYGKREYFSPKLEVAVGVDKNGNIIGGPVAAVEKHAEKFVIVTPGSSKKTEAAKKIRLKLGTDSIDEIAKFLPGGECEVK